jgi:hypothetical protein
MFFFSESPSLLEGTQTFVAAIATLIVLCLFRNDNNFLRQIVINLKDTLQSDIERKISRLKETIAEKRNSKGNEITNDVDFWKKIATETDAQKLMKVTTAQGLIENTFFIHATKSKDIYVSQIDQLDQRESSRLMALFTFIEIIAILTLDSCHINSTLGCIILTLMNWMTLTISVATWTDFLRNKNDYFYLPTYVKKRIALFCYGFIFFPLALYIYVPYNIYGRGILLLLSFLSSIWIFYNYIVYKRELNQHTFRMISKAVLICLIISFMIGILLYVSVSLNWIYNLSSEKIQSWFGIICQNIHTMEYVRVMRVVFVVLCVVNSFVMPLSTAYYYNRKAKKKAMSNINKLHEEALSQVDELQLEYNSVISDIQNNMKKQQAQPQDIYNLIFDGYWRDVARGGLPAICGVCLVYRGTYNQDKDTVSCKEIIFIGFASNIHDFYVTHPRREEFLAEAQEGECIFYSCAEVGVDDQKRVARALTCKQKPKLNNDRDTPFEYRTTRVISKGRCRLLDKDFII